MMLDRMEGNAELWIGRVSLFSFGHSIKVALLHR